MIHLLYVTKADALASGLTHEGTLFGVPAWFQGDDEYVSIASPKIPALHLWCMFADWAYDMASRFMSEDTILRSPINVKRAIQ